jgi:ABC-type transporter Mla subunit MlaD
MRALYPDTLAQAKPPERLEAALAAVEERLAALGNALRDCDAAAVDSHATALQRALTGAIHHFTHAARQPNGVPQALRQRLALASAHVAAQRDSLARASAALERAVVVLMPAPLPAAVYGQGGHSERAATSGCLHA